MGVSRVAMAARLEDVTAEDFKHSSVGVMLSIAFDAGQPAQTRAAVLDAIGERFLADGHTQVLASELAAEIEQKRLAQEQEDREDLAAERRDFPAMVRAVRRGI